MMNGIGGMGGSGARDAGAMFKKMDADGDGKIMKEEMKAEMAKHGKRPQGAAAGGPADIDEMFDEIDTDGDGAITEAENKAQIEKMDAQRTQMLDALKSGDTDNVSALLRTSTRVHASSPRGKIDIRLESTNGAYHGSGDRRCRAGGPGHQLLPLAGRPRSRGARGRRCGGIMARAMGHLSTGDAELDSPTARFRVWRR